jgi:hypothetical protein
MEQKVIANDSDLGAAIRERSRRLFFSPDFVSEEDADFPGYQYVEYAERGIHKCMRVYHPSKACYSQYHTEMDYILGGAEVVFNPNPENELAVRFCEKFISSLFYLAESKKYLHQFETSLIYETDWSVKDGCGPVRLPVPCVIGYTSLQNVGRLRTPLVIWSRHWEIGANRAKKVFESIYDQYIKISKGVAKPPIPKKRANNHEEIDTINNTGTRVRSYLSAIMSGVLSQCENRKNFEIAAEAIPLPSNAESLSMILHILELKMWAVHPRFKELSLILSEPHESMYAKADASFGDDISVANDVWEYPISFELKVGCGTILVGPCQNMDDDVTYLNQKEFLSIKEAARHVGKCEKTIRYWLKKNDPQGNPMLIFKKCGKKFSILRSSLDRWK